MLPLRDTVTFPEMLIPLNVGQPRSIELVNDTLRGDRSLVMVAARNPENEEPGPEELYDVGVIGVIARMIRVPDGTLRVLIQGGQRVRIERWLASDPYLVAEIAEAPDVVRQSPELIALMRNVQQTFAGIVTEVPYLPEELQIMVANVDDPSALSHLIAGALRLPTEEKQGLLEELDVARRLRRLSEILARELEVVALGSKIQSQVQSELEKGQREYFLRQQLKAIQEELGEADEVQAEVAELRAQLDALELPEEVRRRPTASSAGSSDCSRRWRSTASCAATWSGSRRCRGAAPPRTTSTSSTRARSSTRITTTSNRSRTASSSSSPSAR